MRNLVLAVASWRHHYNSPSSENLSCISTTVLYIVAWLITITSFRNYNVQTQNNSQNFFFFQFSSKLIGKINFFYSNKKKTDIKSSFYVCAKRVSLWKLLSQHDQEKSIFMLRISASGHRRLLLHGENLIHTHTYKIYTLPKAR